MKTYRLIAVLILVGLGVAWAVTAPKTVNIDEFEGLTGDIAAGELVFAATGCASCHAAPGAEGEAKLILTGGLEFKTDFGIFHAPNISPAPEAGIGGWSMIDLANALTKGVSPDGKHYYPAFPYGSYTRMAPQDIADLYAYMQTLPADETASLPHEVGFPFNIRRSLGGWKFLFMTGGDQASFTNPNAALLRGQYLVEGMGHCGECHTARNALGGFKSGWLAGGPNPDGKGKIPNITPHEDGIGSWSEGDIVEYLTSGFTPDFDTAGGSMVDVVENIAKLPEADRQAIALYLKNLPAVGSE